MLARSLQPSHTQSRPGLGTAPSPGLFGWDWGLSPAQPAGTGLGLGTESPADVRDWGLSPRPTAGDWMPCGTKSPTKSCLQSSESNENGR